MTSLYQRLAFGLTVALCPAMSAHALIVYGDTNDGTYTSDPAPSDPKSAWKYVVQIGTDAGSASGVYLGNGYVLTAQHVNVAPYANNIILNGVTYVMDADFGEVVVSESPQNVDLKLFKILNPPAAAALAALPLNLSTADSTTVGTMIGCGYGKGATIPQGGWQWADPRVKRWGLNRHQNTASYTGTISYSGFVSYGLQVFFQYPNALAGVGTSIAQAANGDSGGGFFQTFDSATKLSGILTAVGYTYANSAHYGVAPAISDFTYVVRIQKYGPLMRYENWAQAKLGNAAASISADPDGDGLPNLLEYAFHSDPTVAAATTYPQAGMEGSYLTLTYPKLRTATDISYVVEETSDLTNPASWTPATVVEEVVSTVEVTRVIKAKVAMGAAAKKFLRLKVTQLP
jgi:hypothetical protein